MRISGFVASEAQLDDIVGKLKEAGLGNQYEEQAHGESILLSVQTRTFEEREIVKAILRTHGIAEILYSDDSVA